MGFRQRGNEDEAAPKPKAPEQRQERSWSSYADHLTVVIRQGDERGEKPYESAVVISFGEVGADVAIEEFVPELERWLGKQRGDDFAIETRRSHFFSGASAVDAHLVITLLGTIGVGLVSQAIDDGLLALVRERFAPDEVRRPRVRLDWLRNEDPDDAARHLAGWVARAIDRRAAELTLLTLDRGDDEIRAVYDVRDSRYEIRVDETAYRIARLEQDTSGEEVVD